MPPSGARRETREPAKWGAGYGDDSRASAVPAPPASRSVEWDGGKDGKVHFEVLSFARPAPGLLPALCYPVNRLLQLRFGWDAGRAVRRDLLGGQGRGVSK